MSIFNLLKKKGTKKAETAVLQDIAPNVIERMSEKQKTSQFLDIDVKSPQKKIEKIDRTTKPYDSNWKASSSDYHSGSSGLQGSQGHSGSSGRQGFHHASPHGFSVSSSGASSTSYLQKKKFTGKGIPIKVNLHTILQHDDLVYLGDSKIDGFPLYEYNGGDPKTFFSIYPAEELYDASFLK